MKTYENSSAYKTDQEEVEEIVEDKHSSHDNKKRKRVEEVERKPIESTIDTDYAGVYSTKNPKDDWFTTRLHARLYKAYIGHLLQFSEETSKDDKLAIITMIRDTLRDGQEITVKEVPKHVAVCKFCDKYKTITREVSFGCQTFQSGRTCCSSLMEVVDFYVTVREMLKRRQESLKRDADALLEYWE